jgi:hypothetical protein
VAPLSSERKFPLDREMKLSVGLDEADTRELIDQQLRDRGREVDSKILRHALGSRPEKGAKRAIAEWPTANGPADYALFIDITFVSWRWGRRLPLPSKSLRFGDLIGRHLGGSEITLLDHIRFLFSRQTEPHVRLNNVLRYSLAVPVQNAEVGLCSGIALLGRLPRPFRRLRKVLLNALAIVVHTAEAELCAGIAVLSKRPT